jgi:hypothetical protein
MAARYRTRLREIEAVRYNGDNEDEIVELLGGSRQAKAEKATLMGPGRGTHEGVRIETFAGTLTAAVGDWVVRDGDGERSYKPEAFAATYEPVEAV